MKGDVFMKIIISGKKLELTEGIKTAIEDKLGKLERYLNPETEVKVTVSAKKATYAPIIIISPWAKLSIFAIPYTIVYPRAIIA